MKTILKASIYLMFGFAAISSFAATAEEGVENKQTGVSPFEYWTPERLNNAKEMPLPVFDPNKTKELNEDILLDSEPEYQDGLPPQEIIEPDNSSLIPQSLRLLKEETTEDFRSFNRGSLGFNFSSSRLVPLTADLSYPYSTVGKLFFTIPGGGNFVCSGSVINQRVVLTAGHCVHRGSGGAAGYYTNFLFIPAYRDGAAPFRAWSWTFVATTGVWSTSNGIVPNAADYGMIEIADQDFGGTNFRIGSITGILGYQTLSTIPNHAHLLGYPCNFDACEKMHQVTAQSARKISATNAEYGSDMRGGSSGGPWVQNFGVPASGQSGGLNTGLNRVIGVTSYGYVSTASKLQGSSIFDSRFTSLLNIVCGHRVGNC